MAQKVTEEDLKKLPLRAIVAFAVRCARRVQPLLASRDEESGNKFLVAIDEALSLAEQFASRQKRPNTDDLEAATRIAPARKPARAARSAAGAARSAAGAARDAARAAEDAANDSYDVAAAAYVAAATANADAADAAIADAGSYAAYVVAQRRDFERLVALKLGKYPKIGRLVDPSADGPLGDLWHSEKPAWYAELKYRLDKRLGKNSIQSEDVTKQVTRLKETISRVEAEKEALAAKLSEGEEWQQKYEEQSQDLEKNFASRLSSLEADLENQTSVRVKLEETLKTTEKELATNEKLLSDLRQQYDTALSEFGEKLAESEREAAEFRQKNVELEHAIEKVKHELDFETPKSWSELFQSFKKVRQSTILLMVIGIVMLSAVTFTVLAMGEIQRRQQLDRIVKAKIDELRNSLLDPLAARPAIQPAVAIQASSSNPESANATMTNGDTPSAPSLNVTLNRVSHISSQIRTLIVAGADRPSQTASGLRDRFNEVTNPDYLTKSINSDSDDSIWFTIIRLRYWSSNNLLSSVVIFAGFIGAIIASLKSEQRPSPQKLLLGLAAGFVTFLAIRGGKSVFVMELEQVSFMLNPYTSAFLGLLSGTFTNRAYELLIDVTDRLIAQIRRVFLEPAGNGSGTDAKQASDTSAETKTELDRTAAATPDQVENEPTGGDNPPSRA